LCVFRVGGFQVLYFDPLTDSLSSLG
jgi:hypothetical protein